MSYASLALVVGVTVAAILYFVFQINQQENTHEYYESSYNTYRDTRNMEKFISEECTICQDSENRSKSVLLPCKHWFHKDCIKDWIRQAPPGSKVSCPNCRSSFKSCQI